MFLYRIRNQRTRQMEPLNRRMLERLRMLMDWQVRELGYDPNDVTALCLEVDAAEEAHQLALATLTDDGCPHCD